MNKSQTKTLALRQAALICVLVSLLFSVGEGLRLTPVGYELLPVDAGTTREGIGHTSRVPHTTYGPLDVPTQVRSRSKRTFLHVELPPFVNTFEIPAQTGLLLSAQAPALQSVSSTRLPTRGPPAQ